VAHNQFIELALENLKINNEAVVYDIKGIWEKDQVDGRL